MSEGAAGISIDLLCGVFGGICLDFASVRHAFTENCCRCLTCECCGRKTKYTDEREPLIAPDLQPPPLAVSQPALQPAMNIPPQAAIS
ncbi:hypothetical protein K523DRAFT_372569 [Schizophyllum commune Tattone D]|nr:hypothetical protein K523DRAFT_372569 [Schizophyllum commune Tattone D]